LERGAKMVYINVDSLDSSFTEEFDLTVGHEPFIYKEFWRDWHVLAYAATLVLFIYAAKAFVEFYLFKRLHNTE
jgi:hypothetical protein